jgi:hypothetical protein
MGYFTEEEMADCLEEAMMRFKRNRNFGTVNFGKDRPLGEHLPAYEIEFIGTRGELAVANTYGYRPTFHTITIDDYKKPDVGMYDVRATRHRHGNLILFSGDFSGLKVNRPFIMVWIGGYEYELCGWMTPQEAKTCNLATAKYDQTWVPRRALNPMEKIPDAKNRIHSGGQDTRRFLL